ncbi:Fpg/Nei family DNA glycosylase [Microbacterium awajiense]|uniref:Fpg/Nei family DNA glycosylase n=1 Tax=Microbacterium awajiense TaxID=415214 RepID=A0ABP7ABQ3_9MICO
MPESPEVQALAEFLSDNATRRRVEAVDIAEFRAQKTRDRPLATLVGARIDRVRRFGKHVDIATDAGHLVVTFGRAGWARWNGDAAADDAPVIARIDLDGAVLEFTDGGDWLSLGLHVVDDPFEIPAIASLGPDPLDPEFDAAAFAAASFGRRKQLKALLQEQESIAGIGNAYSDEILHVARLSPTAHATALDDVERARLLAAVTGVMRDAACARRGIPLSQQKTAKVAAMRVHGRTGLTCPVCGGAVVDLPGSKAGAQYCPACQTDGTPL